MKSNEKSDFAAVHFNITAGKEHYHINRIWKQTTCVYHHVVTSFNLLNWTATDNNGNCVFIVEVKPC